MAKSSEEEKEEQIKILKSSLDYIYNYQEKTAQDLAKNEQAIASAAMEIKKFSEERADLEKDLIDLDEGAKKKYLDDQINKAQEKLQEIQSSTKQLEENSVTLEKRAELKEEEYKALTGNYYKKSAEEDQSTEATPEIKSYPSEITDTTAIQVFIPLDKEKESFVMKELLERVGGDNLKNKNELEKQDLHDIVNLALKEALEKGSMQKIEPSMSKDDPISCSYEYEGKKLNQKEREDGKFEFLPEKGFSGILRVERQDKDGKLLKDSADIVEYKDGKPIAVIPAKEGETRIANFGAIERQAGIEVTSSKAIADDGIKVAALDPEKFFSRNPVKPTRKAPEPPVPHAKNKEEGSSLGK